MNAAVPDKPTPTPWIVAVSIDTLVTLPGEADVRRGEFHAWLWGRAEDLLGIDAGTVTAAADAPPAPPLQATISDTTRAGFTPVSL